MSLFTHYTQLLMSLFTHYTAYNGIVHTLHTACNVIVHTLHTASNVIVHTLHTAYNGTVHTLHTASNVIVYILHTAYNGIVHTLHTACNIIVHTLHTASNVIVHTLHTAYNGILHTLHTACNVIVHTLHTGFYKFCLSPAGPRWKFSIPCPQSPLGQNAYRVRVGCSVYRQHLTCLTSIRLFSVSWETGSLPASAVDWGVNVCCKECKHGFVTREWITVCFARRSICHNLHTTNTVIEWRGFLGHKKLPWQPSICWQLAASRPLWRSVHIVRCFTATVVLTKCCRLCGACLLCTVFNLFGTVSVSTDV